MKNNIYDLIENADENNTKNNGEDIMKPNKGIVKPLTKKEFKALSKGQAYNHYENISDVANNLRIKADEALEFFKAAKKDALEAEAMLVDARFKLGETETELAEHKVKLGETETELAEHKVKLGETETELANTKSQLEDTEIKLAEAEGKIDAGFDLTTQIQEDLDDLREDVVEARETSKRLSARMTGKRARANINTGTIRHYNNIIRQCKKDIEQGKDVNGNKATILELQAEIRNLQRQVDAANGTFNEMKHNKTVVAQKIDKMDAELDKRYKLNNLLGELGYI